MAYILIADDDADFASAAAKVLTHAGHEVEVQLNTTDALARMQERRPDLLVLDVMFPENPSAGFELARAIQHYHEQLKGLPVVMLTAVNAKFPFGFNASDIDQNWLPVAEFLEKPVEFDVLRNKIEALLAKAKSEGDDAPESK